MRHALTLAIVALLIAAPAHAAEVPNPTDAEALILDPCDAKEIGMMVVACAAGARLNIPAFLGCSAIFAGVCVSEVRPPGGPPGVAGGGGGGAYGGPHDGPAGTGAGGGGGGAGGAQGGGKTGGGGGGGSFSQGSSG